MPPTKPKRATKPAPNVAAPIADAIRFLPQRYVERFPVADLEDFPGNPKEHALGMIGESVDVNGFYGALLVQDWPKTPKYILAGHGRKATLLARGQTHVPVFLVACDKPTARRIVLVDNKASEAGGYDLDRLSTFVEETSALGSLAGTGYTEVDLAKLKLERGTGSGLLAGVDPDAVPDLPKNPVTKHGDLILLGRHRLLCGDARSSDLWAVLMEDRRADAVWTDPPYGVAYKGKTAEELTFENEAVSLEALEDLLRRSLDLAYKHSRPGAPWYVAAPHGPQFLAFAKVLTEFGVWRQTLVWVKQSFVLGRSDFHYRHEAVLHGETPLSATEGDADLARVLSPDPADPLQFVDASHPLAYAIKEGMPLLYGWPTGAPHSYYGDRTEDTVLEFKRPAASKKHPTMKPTALVQKCLELSSEPLDLVVDCFAGSGSTIMAAEAVNRTVCALELSPRYCDVIVERWEQATGQTAVRPSR